MDNLYALACEREDDVTLTNLFAIVADHAERGAAPAQMLAGRMCSGGLGVAQDRQKAMSWYEKAAAQDYGPALEAVGVYYHNSGPTQDRKKAYEYFWRAAAKGLKDSKGYVAELLLSGEAGITNPAAAIEALKMAAESGSIHAQQELGARYKQGRGVPTNIFEAVRWYSAVMTNTSWTGPQHHTGMNLGIMYAMGDGVPRDDAEAFKWFKAATDFDGRDAQDSVGYCYATGRGVPQDDERAIEWFRAAAGVDDPDDKWFFYPAVANLGVMYAEGRGGLQQDMQKAVMLFERAARHERYSWCKVPHAQTALAICLYEGNGTGRDAARALELFRRGKRCRHCVCLSRSCRRKQRTSGVGMARSCSKGVDGRAKGGGSSESALHYHRPAAM
jgi:TPR repeat protein